jgi:hypothetical protein
MKSMQKMVRVYQLGEEVDDAVFWAAKSPQERIKALETIRNANFLSDGTQRRLQRIYRVVK